MIARSALRETVKQHTTDIMNEPIAADGLKRRFHKVGSRSLEVLCEPEYAVGLATIAHSINADNAMTEGNVIDVKSRKAISRETLSYNIVVDNAPGRHSTGWVIFEATGTPHQIAKLAREIENLFAEGCARKRGG